MSDDRELQHLREFERRVYDWLDKPWREERWQALVALMPEEWHEVDNIGRLWSEAEQRLSRFVVLPWWRRLLAYLRKDQP